MRLRNKIQASTALFSVVGIMVASLFIGFFSLQGFQEERRKHVTSAVEEALAWMMPALEVFDTSTVKETLRRGAKETECVLNLRLSNTKGYVVLSNAADEGVQERRLNLLERALETNQMTWGPSSGSWVAYYPLRNGYKCKACHQGEVVGALAVDVDSESVPSILTSGAFRVGATTWLVCMMVCAGLAIWVGRLADRGIREMEWIGSRLEEARGDLAVDLGRSSTDEGKKMFQKVESYLESMRMSLDVLREGFGDVAKGCRSVSHMLSQLTTELDQHSQKLKNLSEHPSALSAISVQMKAQMEIAQHIGMHLSTSLDTDRAVIAMARDMVIRESETLRMLGGIQKAFVAASDLSGEQRLGIEHLMRFASSMSDMADQSRLVGFRAAVQGYRSGSQASTFGVVAETVEKIADETSYASRGAQDTIETLDENQKKLSQLLSNETKVLADWSENRKRIVQDFHAGVASLEASLKDMERAEESFASLVEAWPELLRGIEEAEQSDRNVHEVARGLYSGLENQKLTIDEVLGALDQALSRHEKMMESIRTIQGSHSAGHIGNQISMSLDSFPNTGDNA